MKVRVRHVSRSVALLAAASALSACAGESGWEYEPDVGTIQQAIESRFLRPGLEVVMGYETFNEQRQ